MGSCDWPGHAEFPKNAGLLYEPAINSLWKIRIGIEKGEQDVILMNTWLKVQALIGISKFSNNTRLG